MIHLLQELDGTVHWTTIGRATRVQGTETGDAMRVNLARGLRSALDRTATRLGAR